MIEKDSVSKGYTIQLRHTGLTLMWKGAECEGNVKEKKHR